MSQPGRYANILWLLGALLDREAGDEIEIRDEGTFFAVGWQTAGGPRQEHCLGEADWPALQHAAERTPPKSLGRASLLRALGRELDREQIDVARLAQGADGFLVTGSAGGRYLSCRYEYSELGAGIAPGPGTRSSGLAAATPPPAPYAPEPSVAPVSGAGGVSLRQRLQAMQSARP